MPFPDLVAGKVMVQLMNDKKTTRQIADDLCISSETVRYVITCMQLMGIVQSVAVVEDGGKKDILWSLTEHALFHRQQVLSCAACKLREMFLWGGPVLE